MEVLCINKNALTTTLTGLLLMLNKCTFPQLWRTLSKALKKLLQRVSNLQQDIRDLQAKSHHYCQTNITQDIAQQVLA